MKQKLLFSFLLCFSLFTQALAQERTVRGKVTDPDSGEGLPGVSVFVKGTTSGTVTDAGGNYSITAPEGSTLVFQAVGLGTREVAVGANTVVDVQMLTSTKELGEVVVTAIGIEREKKGLGYSVSNIESSAIAQRSEPDPLRALSGKMPGVVIQGSGGAPGQSTKINMRGYSSLTGNTQPLFVVDGIPFDNSVNPSSGASGGTQYSNRAYDIDPNNIESITVLKGAAASALYGSRATNGVIVITTKAGKKNAKKGLEVTVNSSVNIEKLSGIPDYQNTYGQGSNQNYNGGFIGNWGAPFPNHVDRLNATYGTNYSKVVVPGYPEGTVPHPLVTTGFAAPRFSSVFPEFFDAAGKAIAVPYQPYDFIKEFFETGTIIENGFNITTGGETASINAGASRTTNDGIVPNSKSSRTSLNFGGNAQLANGLFISGTVNYVNTNQSNPQIGASIFGGNFGTAENSIFTRLFFLPRNFNLMGYPFENPVTGDNVFYRALDNPRWVAKYNIYNSKVNRVFGNIALSYDITKWLNAILKGGINTYSENRRNIIRPGGVADANGRVWTDDLVNTEMDYNLIFTVTKDINENFGFRGIVGGNVNQREFSRRFVDGDGVISTGLYTTATTSSQIVTSDYTSLRRFYAFYADLQFSYKNFLFLGLVGRNDWSSALPAANRSYFYPGANISFVFTDVLKLPKNIINYGKIRTSLTRVGNEPGAYLTSTIYRIGTPFTSSSGGISNRASLDNLLGNAELKPEFTTEFEAGTELRFIEKIGLDFTYFNRSSTQQITEARLPASSGFISNIVNAGEIKNTGIEIGLDVTPISTASGFKWNTFFAFTQYKSKVVSAGVGGDILVGGFNSALGTIHRTGFPYGQIFGSKNARDDAGNLLIDENLGTTIILPTAEIIGDPNPDFILGINNNFSFKGFNLGVLLDWKQGGDLYSTTAGSLTLRGQLKITEDREGLRIIPGVYGDPATFLPILVDGATVKNSTPITSFDYFFSNGFGPYGADETNIYDATVFRLRELSLGYVFPKSILQKTPFGSAKISVSARNLWFYTPNLPKGLNMDPEVLAETSASNVQGFEYGAAPTTRRYGFNIMFTF